MTRFFDQKTGAFSGRKFSASPKNLALNTPAGFVAIEGEFDPLSQRVDVEALAKAEPGDHSAAQDFVVVYERPAAEIEAEQGVARTRAARQHIDRLERAQLRPLRELAIDPNNAQAKQRLQAIDDEISARRLLLATVPVQRVP